MKEHLSPERIARWMAGERTPEEEEHVSACSRCSGETARLEEALAGYRGAVRQWSGRESRGPREMNWESVRPRNPAWHVWRWAAGAAAVVALAAVPVWTNASGEKARALADAALMEQVDAGISRAVPAPVEPLAELAVSDAGTADGSSTRNVQ